MSLTGNKQLTLAPLKTQLLLCLEQSFHVKNQMEVMLSVCVPVLDNYVLHLIVDMPAGVVPFSPIRHAVFPAQLAAKAILCHLRF